MYPFPLSSPTPRGNDSTETVATTVVPEITVVVFEPLFATYAYPLPLSNPTPHGPFPTGTVAMTVPPLESGVGAEVPRPPLNWFDAPCAAPRNLPEPPHASEEKAVSRHSPIKAAFLRSEEDPTTMAILNTRLPGQVFGWCELALPKWSRCRRRFRVNAIALPGATRPLDLRARRQESGGSPRASTRPVAGRSLR